MKISSWQVRRWLLFQDSTELRCAWCRRRLSLDEVTRDHLVPRGPRAPKMRENIVGACQSCNGRRGRARLDRWIRRVVAEHDVLALSTVRQLLLLIAVAPGRARSQGITPAFLATVPTIVDTEMTLNELGTRWRALLAEMREEALREKLAKQEARRLALADGPATVGATAQ